MPPKGIVEFAIGQQSGIGGDHRPTKLQHQTAVVVGLFNGYRVRRPWLKVAPAR